MELRSILVHENFTEVPIKVTQKKEKPKRGENTQKKCCLGNQCKRVLKEKEVFRHDEGHM